jgi:hypothetical protein
MLLLVIALLATVTFDGILEPPLWAYVDVTIINAPDDSTLWTVFDFSEAATLRFGRTIGLVLFVALFSAAYLSVCKIMAAATDGQGGGTADLARLCVPKTSSDDDFGFDR